MGIKENVINNLKEMGESYETLKPFLQDKLNIIEEVIQTKRNSQIKAELTLREMDYSVKTISEESGIGRTTMYSHSQLLKRYIEFSANKAEESNPFNEIKKYQSEKSSLQQQIKKMVSKDIDVELLKIEIENLQNALQEKDRIITSLRAQIKHS